MNALSLLIGATLLTSAISFGQTNSQPPRVTLQLTPLLQAGQTTVAAGSTFSVVMYANSPGQLVNLYAYQFDLKFDSNKLQALQVSEGVSFKNTGVSDFIPGVINSPAGVIGTSFNSLQGKTASVPALVSPLVVVQFKAIQAGSTDISLQSPVLLDPTGARVPLTLAPLTVTIQ